MEISLDIKELEIFKLNLRPDDTIIISYPDGMTPEEIDSAAKELKYCFPDNKILFVSNTMKFDIVQREKGLS